MSGMKAEDLKGLIAELFPESEKMVLLAMIRELDEIPMQVAHDFADRYMKAYEEDSPIHITSEQFQAEVVERGKVVMNRYRNRVFARKDTCTPVPPSNNPSDFPL